MITTDFLYVLQWWGAIFFVGLIFFPLTKLIFKNSPDSFYVFSKVLGIGIVSYLLLLFGTIKLLPFNLFSILLILILFLFINVFIIKKYVKLSDLKPNKIIVFEELLFFTMLCSWAYIRAHEPSIQTLEKFMDFGFVNSILRSDYFPPKDMWLTPFSINYYFFGHLATAMITKLSFVPSFISYNLMIATLFALTFSGGFSLLYNFLQKLGNKKAFMGGLLGGILLSLSGNLHTIYSLFLPYTGATPSPPWLLTFLPNLFPNNYWYPNATRFIPYTIHEFPLYSFVVSDLHGHVLDIPFVLFTIALTYTILQAKKITKLHGVILSLFLAILYMTNVWDGIIYLGLSVFVVLIIKSTFLHIKLKRKNDTFLFPFIVGISNIKQYIFETVYVGGLLIIFYILFSLPFNFHFKPFVSGIGILCAPEFLTNVKSLGPLIFEKDHCQHSPFYQLVILYGFFAFFAFSFLLFLARSKKKIFSYSQKTKSYAFSFPTDMTSIFIILLLVLSLLLIIVPELMYAKDIYPQHYRANTMFKLVYQAFIMLTLASAYSIVYLQTKIKRKIIKFIFFLITFLLLVPVLLYPYFAIKSFYGDLREYKGLNGINYIQKNNPGDLEAIIFLNKNITGQPVILEAQGDSYTNFGRISANTGLPTILGWTVHEWLWRGSYDIPQPRITEVATMYEGGLSEALPLLKTYNVKYVVVGNEETTKYKVNETTFTTLGKLIFKSKDNTTKIYQLEL